MLIVPPNAIISLAFSIFQSSKCCFTKKAKTNPQPFPMVRNASKRGFQWEPQEIQQHPVVVAGVGPLPEPVVLPPRRLRLGRAAVALPRSLAQPAAQWEFWCWEIVDLTGFYWDYMGKSWILEAFLMVFNVILLRDVMGFFVGFFGLIWGKKNMFCSPAIS